MTAEEEHPHHHHLPKMADDDDDEDDDNHNEDDQHYPYPPPSYHPGYPDQYPPHPRPHRTPTPPPHRNTPPPPSHSHHPSPHTPRHVTPPPSQKHRSPTPPPPPQKPPTPSPLPPPQKPRVIPPPYTNFADQYDDEYDYDKYGAIRRQIFGVLTILLLLIAVAALVLWLIYRPHKPTFFATSAAVYSLNATALSTISAAVQLTIVARNPNRRTALHLDRLAVAVYYRAQAVTPPSRLPPLKLGPRTAVMMSPLVGGAAVAVEDAAVAEGMAADEAYGVVGLSWVMVGRVRYKAGGWFKSGHGRVYVKCDVIVGLRHGTPGVVSGGVFSNPSGQVPLLGVTPCLVDI